MSLPLNIRSFAALCTLLAALLSALTVPGADVAVAADTAPAVVNLYSARHYGPLEATFKQFTAETGIEVRLSQGSVQSLLERLRAEGASTPADVFFSIDAGGLALAANEGLLQPVQSAVLQEAIPAGLRDPNHRWFALTQRVRTLVYNPAKVKPTELSTYEALADPKWRGRLCLRPASHIYTLSLTASLIVAQGPAKAAEVVKGWVANNPRYIDSDSRILETLAAGGCDVAIVNHYYLGRELAKNAAFPIKLLWANQQDRGVHLNVSGMGVTANARNQANAIKLIEWLATQGQGDQLAALATSLPGGNDEFPVNPKAPVLPRIAAFGPFKADPLPLSDYGRLQADALKLLQEAKYQ